eukprot:TRINITY_DN53767_c0_g1_i1.p1 TRINITY_DN53767_c0_g1~~TRINITY_DN53767_c0_g1_i1.p1  ORF type:complete len:340 (+),score=65.66 TRINITY_DN53767_c0_g1_i1:94-1113(+)
MLLATGRRLSSAKPLQSRLLGRLPLPLGFAIAPLRVGVRSLRSLCTMTGAVTLAGFGLCVCPYVAARAPLADEEREALSNDVMAIAAWDRDGKELSQEEFWAALSEGRLPPLSFHDLQRPWLFKAFEWVGRFTFACYSDAAGVMTSDEFKCAVHKMVDLVLEVQSQRQASAVPAAARAAAVRELTGHIAPAVFQVLNEDQDDSISAQEFLHGALVLLATVQGAPLDTPQLAGLAFRVVNARADGLVTLPELTRWVTLSVEHGVTPPEALIEPRGPFGIFGVRQLTSAQLAKKWLREADSDRDGKLLPDEFAALAPRLRLHEVIGHMALKFAHRRLPACE